MHLFIWFFRQHGTTWKQLRNGAFVNTIVSYISPPYCHVELAFEDGTAVTVLKNNTEARIQLFVLYLSETTCHEGSGSACES